MIYNIIISIHALREESDVTNDVDNHYFKSISIHALREESDTTAIASAFCVTDFNPRSP